MKKRLISSGLLLTLVLSLFVSTAMATNISPFWLYTTSCSPSLSFTGTTAKCGVKINCADSSTKITGTLRLIHEKTDGTEATIETWALSGTGYLNFSATAAKPVTKGQTYRVEVDATIKAPNGTEYPYTYTRATCP